MPNYNPYQYLGAYGYGGPGMGSNWSYGQQGQNNPYGQAQQGSANYQQSYPGGGGNFYYPGGGQSQTGCLGPGGAGRMPQPPGQGSYWNPNNQSYQSLSPTQGGKGGGGGFGSNLPRGMGDWSQQPRDPWQTQMDFHQRLLQQRQMEEALGAQQGWAWYNPFGRDLSTYSYARPQGQQSMGEYEQSRMAGPYGDRGW